MLSETITTINVPTAQPAGILITVTDRKTLCSDDYSITLTQPTALTITSATATNVFCSNFQFTNYGFSYRRNH
jgi:hypothetical protein